MYYGGTLLRAFVTKKNRSCPCVIDSKQCKNKTQKSPIFEHETGDTFDVELL